MRLTHHEYFFKIVEAVALRSSCDRGRSGAVIVKDNRIVATGYVGTPRGMPHCDDVGHMLERHTRQRYNEDGALIFGASLSTDHCIATLHSEQNAILQAARFGPPLDGAQLYCTMVPCYVCAKLITNAGIMAVHALWDYQASEMTKELFKKVKIELTLEHDEVLKYAMENS